MEEHLSGASAHPGTVEALIGAHLRAPRPRSDLFTLLLELDIQELARFLSHADLQRALMRCCVRAQLELSYTQGFNPRPRLSLPLPKPVGLASSGDVLCVRLRTPAGGAPDTSDRLRMKRTLAAQLPQGIDLRGLYVLPGKVTLYPQGFSCTLCLKCPAVKERVAARVPEVMAQAHLPMERTNPRKPVKTKQVNIRPFIASIEIADQVLRVNCLVLDAGSIRVEEILTCLGLDPADLDGPVQRDHLIWKLQ